MRRPVHLKESSRFSGLLIGAVLLSTAASSQVQNRENLAHECFDLMYYQQGIDLAERILADKPKAQEWRIRQAFAWTRLAKPDAALAALQRESELDLEGWEARAFASALHWRLGRGEEADRLAREARTILLKKYPRQSSYPGPGLWPAAYVPGSYGEAAEDEMESGGTKYAMQFQPAPMKSSRLGTSGNPASVTATAPAPARPLKKAGRWHLPFPAPNAGLPAYVAALAADSRGGLDDARLLYGEAERFGYDALACLIRRADVLARASRPLEAEALIVDSMGEGGVHAEAYALLALIRTERGDWTGALDAIGVASELKPFEKDFITTQAVLILAADPKSLRGRELLELAVKIDPSDPGILGWLIDARAGRNVFAAVQPAALARLRSSLKARFTPHYQYQFFYELNGVLTRINWRFSDSLKSGILSYAATYLADFLAVDDRSAQMNYNLGLLLNSLGQTGRAFAYAWRTVALDPFDRDACDLLGNLFLRVRDFAHSVEMYREAAALAPEDPLGHLNLGVALKEGGDLDRAFDEWRRAIALDKPPTGGAPDKDKSKSELDRDVTVRDNSVSFSAYLNIGAAERGRGRSEEAVAAFMSAAALRPDSPNPWFEIGLVRLGQGFERDARAAFERFTSMGGSEARVKQALAAAQKK